MTYYDAYANSQHVAVYYNRLDIWDDARDASIFYEGYLIRLAARWAWGSYEGRFAWGN